MQASAQMEHLEARNAHLESQEREQLRGALDKVHRSAQAELNADNAYLAALQDLAVTQVCLLRRFIHSN